MFSLDAATTLFDEAFRGICGAAPLAACVIEMPSQRYVFANQAYCGALKNEFRPETIRGRAIAEVLPNPKPEALAAIQAAHAENKSTRLDALKSESMAQESSYWTGVTVPVYRDAQRTFVLALLVDVTESVLSQERDRNSATTAMAVHELRSPLTSLKILTGLCRRMIQDGRHEELDGLLRKIDQQADSLTRLVADLYEMARISCEKIDLVPRPTRFFEELRGCVEAFAELYPTHPVAIEIPGDSGTEILLDRERLGQVVLNLLNNAAKYSEPGSKITVSGMETSRGTAFCVTDEGIGIAQGELEKVFERFYQVPEGRKPGSLGLGLYLARETVRRMGGRIWAESKGIGKGAAFFVEFPK